MKNLLRQFISLILALIVVIWFLVLFTKNTKAMTFNNDFPKLANYFLDWDIDDAKINTLAQWDLVIVSNAAYSRNPQLVTKLRQKNPNIIILVYVVAQESLTFSPTIENGNFFKEIYNEVDKNDWWLYKANGKKMSTWPGADWINLASTAKVSNGKQFTDWLPEQVNKKYLATGVFDGVFYDNVFDNITWASKEIDINRDGLVDSDETINKKWQEGVIKMIENTKRLAPNKIILANTNSNFYNTKTNGRLLEHFPKQNEGGWSGNLNLYLNNNIGREPKIFVLNANNSNINDQFSNLKRVRFTYTSSLLGDGYYSYTIGDQTHASLWWYDEYNVHLGTSLGSFSNIADGSTQIKPGVFKREFANGTIFVNATNQTQTINLPRDFEKIKGSQAPDINNGAIIRKLTLASNDGIVLQSRVGDATITNAVYINGSFVKPYNKYGSQVQRNGFFLFDKQTAGNKVIARVDLENDGSVEKVVAGTRTITIYNEDGTARVAFQPYGSTYRQGLNMDIGDVNKDGKKEIVTGTRRGWGPIVKVFDYNGKTLNNGFYVFAKTYNGGVNVALADLNGNNKKDIVVGAGYFGGPQVRIFDGTGKLVSGGFFAYNKTFRGGVNVAAGDIDGDGIDEIITGAGVGGSTHVRIFNGKTKPLNPGFFAYSKTSRTGVKIFVADLDNDGIDEILAANPNPFN